MYWNLSPLKLQPIKARAYEFLVRYSRPGAEKLVRPFVAEATSLQSFEKARQLRATFDSIDYAEAHMQDAQPYADKRAVLEEGLKNVATSGLFLEFGVWSGRTINYIAERHSGIVHGFDSFEGLPEDWALHYKKGDFATHGSLPEVRPNVRLHVGWFEKTLPDFMRENEGPVAFLHVDSDLYSSAKTIFQFLGERLVPGSVIVFDEYYNYPGWRDHEFKAFQELVFERHLRYRYIAYNTNQYNVAVLIE